MADPSDSRILRFIVADGSTGNSRTFVAGLHGKTRCKTRCETRPDFGVGRRAKSTEPQTYFIKTRTSL